MNNLLKISGAALLAVSLVGCGGVKTIKQESGDSDAKQILKLTGVNNPTEYIVDGKTPESANVGVPESILQKFNSSSGRHVLNYMAGGIGGLISLGILQNDAFTQYKDDYNILNNPRFLYISSNSIDYDEAVQKTYKYYQDSFKELGSDEVVILDKKEKRAFKDGGGCSFEKRDCFFYDPGYYTNGDSFSFDSFPISLKPSYISEKYEIGNYNLFSYKNNQLVNEAENFKLILKKYSKSKTKNVDLFLYLPASFNNGTPVIIDESGKEHYFVKK